MQDTNIEEYNNLKLNWDKIQLIEQKKRDEENQKRFEVKIKRKERVKVRNDQLGILEDLDIEVEN